MKHISVFVLLLPLLWSGCGEKEKSGAENGGQTGRTVSAEETVCPMPNPSNFHSVLIESCNARALTPPEEDLFYRTLLVLDLKMKFMQPEVLKLESWSNRFKALTPETLDCLAKSICGEKDK